MKDNISPEEKLLRLIRGQKKQIVSPENKIASREKASLFRLKLPNIAIQKYLFLANISKFVLAAFTISCLYLVYSFISPSFTQNLQLPKTTDEVATEEEVEPVKQVKPYGFYSQGLADRQIFGSASQEPEKPIGKINADLLKDMSLVGIVSGDNPQAIIEDKKTQKTYYLTRGQLIGEFRVDDIEQGKVILNYNGQKFELYL